MRMNSSFITLPNIVTGPGQYITRSGETVTIVGIERRYWAKGHYSNGVVERWDISGRVLPFSESSNDIVKPTGVLTV